MKTRPLRFAALAAFVIVPLAHAEGDSPWLPVPGESTLSLSYAIQKGDSAYIGTTDLPISAITGGATSEYERTTTQLRFGYGISDALAFDATIGYGDVDAGADSENGLTDTLLGLSYRVLDEYERPGLPTVTLRGAAIIAGDYDGARLAALGKDENGIEYAVLAGKQLTTAWSAWAGLGGLSYSGDVPSAWYYDLGTRVRLGQGFSASLGYSDKRYDSDLDIGGSGFTPARFQEVREERNLVKLGFGYGFGNQGIALNLARIVDGRNTVRDDQIVGLSYSLGF
ncbi:MAG: hypothetical protein HZB57_06650 [Gammaproteobacteria bacterium]|nr:hypothetical protein [Gammaproteobacteria bacterium]